MGQRNHLIGNRESEIGNQKIPHSPFPILLFPFLSMYALLNNANRKQRTNTINGSTKIVNWESGIGNQKIPHSPFPILLFPFLSMYALLNNANRK